MGYFLEACAAKAGTQRCLSSTGPISWAGSLYKGRMSDAEKNSYTELIVRSRSGTVLPSGSSRGLITARGILDAKLTVIEMEGWHRAEDFDATGLKWVNPSPNLRSIAAAKLYPGIGLMDYANVSVGRGTDTPFEHIGAAYIDGTQLAAYLQASRTIPGVTFHRSKVQSSRRCEPLSLSRPGNPRHSNGSNGRRKLLDAPELGIELIAAIHKLYPEQFPLKGVAKLNR